jgi:AcrR family transcriptional regulator
MTPRPYDAPARRRTADEGRERILAASREVLNLDDLRSFSLEAVAQRAGVTRMTVYNQFGSKGALLGEVFDTLIERDAFSKMPAVFQEEDAGVAFDQLVGILGRFYTDNQVLMARMAVAAGIDPDLDEVIRTKNLRRRRAIETLVQRIADTHEPAVAPAELVNTLDVLLNFSTFKGIAGPSRTPKAVVPHMRRMIRGVLGLPAAARSPRRGKTR